MERLGIKFKLSKDGLIFQGKRVKPSLRLPKEMEPVVMDPTGLEGWKGPLYYMYRGLEKVAKAKEFIDRSVRYDLTLIKPGFIGSEYVKTFGHYHPRAGKSYYTEFYEVLSGNAVFLFQDRRLDEFIVVEAKKGEGVFIPPGYGHVTVNVGRRPLLIGNLVMDGFSSNYSIVKKKRGFAYYLLRDLVFVTNPRYKTHPTLMFALAEKFDRLDKMFLEYPDEMARILKGIV